VTYFFRFLFFL